MLFESGQLEPGQSTIEALAEALNFPYAFLIGANEIDEIPSDAASFRALTKMTAGQRNAALAAGSLALALNDWIGERFHLPAVDVPKLSPGIDPETAAQVVRAEWAVGEAPIANVVHLLEAHGVRVFSLAEESREIDAFSIWRSGLPLVFLNTQKSAEHRRFDAAHELGHLALHWHHGEPPQGRVAEREAHAFASALLMPRAAMLATAPRLVTLSEVIREKRRWRVSAMAYVHRLHRLNLLSDWRYRALTVELSRRGYRTTEHHSVGAETSQVLQKVFSALRKEGISKTEVAKALDLYVEDIEALVFGLTMLPISGSAGARNSASDARSDLRLVEQEVGALRVSTSDATTPRTGRRSLELRPRL